MEEAEGNRRFIEATLKAALSGNATQRHIAQVYKLPDKLEYLDLKDEINKSITDLLITAFTHQNLLKNDKGRKFLAQMYHKISSRIQDLLEAIQVALRTGKAAIAESLADVSINIWISCDETERKLFEVQCLKPIADWSIRAETPLFHKNCRSYLEKFKEKRRRKELSAAMAHIYEPIIFRYLHSANPLVRDNALDIFTRCAFPINSPSFTTEKNSSLLESQIEEFKSIIKDDCPKVRASATKCLCRVLYEFWGLFQESSTPAKSFVDLIVKDMSHDIAYQVRAAAMEGLNFLCGIMDGLDTISIALPDFADLIHDPNESVRIGFIKLLTTISTQSSISIFQIIHLDHFIYRLKFDSPNVVSAICELLNPSMFSIVVKDKKSKKKNKDNSGEEEEEVEDKKTAEDRLKKLKLKTNKNRISRCIFMCHRNLRAAEKFYSMLPRFVSSDEIIDFVNILSLWSLENINKVINPNSKKKIMEIKKAQSSKTELPPMLPQFEQQDDLVRLFGEEQRIIKQMEESETKQFEDEDDEAEVAAKKKKQEKPKPKKKAPKKKQESEEEDDEEEKKEAEENEEEEEEEKNEEEEQIEGTIEEYQAVWAVISSIICSIANLLSKDSEKDIETIRKKIFHDFDVEKILANLPHVLRGSFFKLLAVFPKNEKCTKLTLDYLSEGKCLAWSEALNCLKSWGVLGDFLKTQTDEIHFALTGEHLIPQESEEKNEEEEEKKEEEKHEEEEEEKKEEDNDKIDESAEQKEESRSVKITKSLRYLMFMFSNSETRNKIDGDTETIEALLTELNQFLPMMYEKLGLKPESPGDALSEELSTIANELSESCYLNAVKLIVAVRTHLAIKILKIAKKADEAEAAFRTFITQISECVFEQIVKDITVQFVNDNNIGPETFQFKILKMVLTLSADMIREHIFDDDLYNTNLELFKSFAANPELEGHELRSVAFQCLATVAVNLAYDAYQAADVEQHPAQEILDYSAKLAQDEGTEQIVIDLVSTLTKMEKKKRTLPWLAGELQALSDNEEISDSIRKVSGESLAAINQDKN